MPGFFLEHDMEWMTDKRTGAQTGLLFIIGLIVLDILWLIVLTTQPIGSVTFFMGVLILASLPLIGMIAYQLYGLARSGYDVDRNSLVIYWGAIRQILPVEAIQRIMAGAELEYGVSHFRGWRWPGLMAGHGELPDAGLTLFYATLPLEQQLILITPTLSYAISPVDAAGFIESIKARYELGPTQAVEQKTEHPAFFEWPLWRDRLVHYLLITGTTMCLLLFGLVCFRFPDLPSVIPLHYNALGLPDRTAPTAQIFILPLIGLLALGVNTLLGGLVYRRETMAAYLLWGGTIIVQVLLWIGTMNLLRV
jgi:hypothetical protein